MKNEHCHKPWYNIEHKMVYKHQCDKTKLMAAIFIPNPNPLIQSGLKRKKCLSTCRKEEKKNIANLKM